MTSKSSDEIKILELPYTERQLVVVSDDAIVKAARKVELENAGKQKNVSWGSIASAAASIALGGAGLIIAEGTRIGLEAWSRARENGLRVLQVAQ